jgi:nickel/cobalt transporter (NiCoT) family protein
MMGPVTGAAAPALGLVFLLGLRHGLDPDHVAVIDNLTFQASPSRPRLAPWTGFLFSLGHSLSVSAVAIGISLVFKGCTWPGWASELAEWLTIAVLLLVGVLNLRALSRPGPFTPQGWRQSLLPKSLRRVSHPLGVVLVGVLFGLVFDTASQAAAWGAAAAMTAGVAGAAAVGLTFSAGMILVDALDSRIVARLLQAGGGAALAARYRRAVGWLIVALSLGMAGYGLVTKLRLAADASELAFSAVGVAMALGVIGLLGLARRSRPIGRHADRACSREEHV